VESGIKYVKNNFFLGRKFTDEEDAKERLFKMYFNSSVVRERGNCDTASCEAVL